MMRHDPLPHYASVNIENFSYYVNTKKQFSGLSLFFQGYAFRISSGGFPVGFFGWA